MLNDETSALTDSFQDNILAPPVYTRPSSFNKMEVQNTSLRRSKENRELERKKFLEKTKKIRPDLLNQIIFFKKTKNM